MARARFIRPEFYEDDKVGSLSFGARLLYPRTWIEADMQGVFEWNPKIFRIKAFPHDEKVRAEHVQAWMDEIAAQGMVEFFTFEGKTFGHILHFVDHQSFTSSEVKAGNRHPAPPSPGSRTERTSVKSAPGRLGSDKSLTLVRRASDCG
jgi:hypothetical protein